MLGILIFKILILSVLFSFMAWLFSFNMTPLIKLICLLVLLCVILLGIGYIMGIGFTLAVGG